MAAAATAAGLPAELSDFLVLASRGLDARYVAEYDGAEVDTSIVVTNSPPDRRIDRYEGTVLVTTNLVVDGAAHDCVVDGAETVCERTDGFVEPPGVFSESALAATIESLADRMDEFAITVEDRSLVGVDARCLISTPRASRTDEEVDELCLSDDGVVLLAVQGTERLVATAYGTSIPAGAFEIPA